MPALRKLHGIRLLRRECLRIRPLEFLLLHQIQLRNVIQQRPVQLSAGWLWCSLVPFWQFSYFHMYFS